jgi:hypothetical protein
VIRRRVSDSRLSGMVANGSCSSSGLMPFQLPPVLARWLAAGAAVYGVLCLVVFLLVPPSTAVPGWLVSVLVSLIGPTLLLAFGIGGLKIFLAALQNDKKKAMEFSVPAERIHKAATETVRNAVRTQSTGAWRPSCLFVLHPPLGFAVPLPSGTSDLFHGACTRECIPG